MTYENKKFKKDFSKPSLQTSTVVGDNQDDLISGLVGGSPIGFNNQNNQNDIDLDELKAFLDEGYNKPQP